MKEKDENFLFKGRIRDFERIVLRYYIEQANFNEQSRVLAKILAYLNIYGNLTQKKLKILTKFSSSTISTSLSNLINIGYIKKEKILKSREYNYFSAFPTQESIDETLGRVTNEIRFFKEKINALENISIKNINGYNLLLNRLKDAVEIFELYHEILDIIQDPASPIDIDNKKIPQKSITRDDIKNIYQEFDPSIKKIEQEIIDFYLYESVYSTLNEFFLIIYVYFITRKVLTQEKIRELTGLSFGKVSQVINSLVKKQLIEKLNKNEYGNLIPKKQQKQIFYSMTSIHNSFLQSGFNSLKEIMKWEEEFKNIKSELINGEKNLKQLNGYDKILKLVNKYLDLLPIYKKAKLFFSKIL
ncbi:MAG: hypothetical protein JXA99_17695 [Candidatus Lokiarchaeota archaeon]|nr:hypothetical protein [Candidatus Lokiarchaeota archaeon]